MTTIIERIQNLLPNIADLVGFEGLEEHPIHGSTTGKNFSVDKANNCWFCFRCKSGGYALHYIALRDGLLDCNQVRDKANFKLVLEQAAREVGLEKELQQSWTKATEEAFYQQNQFYSILHKAQEYFVNSLNLSDESKKLYEYIQLKWGFNKEQSKQLGFGYAPDKATGLCHFFELEGFLKQDMLRSGLVKPYEKDSATTSNVHDVFRNVLTLPWLDTNNNPMFFIGRDPDYEMKMHNAKTKDEKKFIHKYRKQLVNVKSYPFLERDIHQPIFGMAQLERMNKKDVSYIVIAEGITDAMSLQLWNIPVLSPVTTGFSEKQIKEIIDFLKQYNVPVYICFDNELNLAGLKGVLRTLDAFPDDLQFELFYAELPLPENKDKIDVNEFFATHTKADFLEVIKNALPKKKTLELWRHFKNPYCIDRLLARAFVPTNNKAEANFILAKELYYTMDNTWDETAKILTKSSATKMQDGTLDHIEKQVLELPLEIQQHSCAFILGNTFMKNYCKMKECFHVSDDYPQYAKLGFDNYAIYEKLYNLRFVRHPKDYGEKYFKYELIFPIDEFDFNEDIIDNQVSIILDDKELNSPTEFETQFRALSSVQFEIPGAKKTEKQLAWKELVQYWFQHKEILFKGETAAHTPYDIQEQFLLFVDSHNKRYLTFDLEEMDSYPIDDSIYYIHDDDNPNQTRIYVPMKLIRKYMTEHWPAIKISDLRTYLKHWIAGNVETPKIRGIDLRVWPFFHTPEQYPKITTFYKEEMIKRQQTDKYEE
jgi:hypothetical protein